MHEQLLSVADVCKRLCINRTSLHNLRKSGKFPPPIMIGRSVRFRQCDIDGFVQSLAAGAVVETRPYPQADGDPRPTEAAHRDSA